MLVTYVQKLVATTEQNKVPVITELASRAMFQFDITKSLSAGIRQAAVADLNSFFDSIASQTILNPEDLPTTIDKQVMAQELRNLATLVEEGSRVVGVSMFNDVHNNNRKIILQITNPS